MKSIIVEVIDYFNVYVYKVNSLLFDMSETLIIVCIAIGAIIIMIGLINT